ncbi:MAG: AI-2E family transporter [Clostridiaceae bacterium]|nr:AI-2E family transporter [Clostridiaceae bacterium]
MINMKKYYKFLLSFISILIVLYIFISMKVVRDVLYTILLSFTVAYAIKPIQKKLMEKGLNKKASAILLIIGFGLVCISLLAIIIPSIFNESNSITAVATEIKKLIINIEDRYKEINSNEILHKMINEFTVRINGILMGLTGRLLDVIMGIGDDIISILVMPIIIYYFLSDSETITNAILVFLPIGIRNIVRKILKDIDKVLSRYVVSQFLLCILVGIMTFVILFFYGVEFPVILSILNAAFNVIPYFGPIFGALPAVFIAVLKSPMDGVWVGVWLWVLQQIEGNIISPKFTGDSVNMHPLIVIILLIVGGKVAGFWGMVLAVPLGVIIKVVYEDLNYYLF